MPVRWWETSPEHKLFLKLLAYRTAPTRVDVPWEPFCDNPVSIHRAKRASETTMSVEANLKAPCRVCPKCLQFRQMKWRERAINELNQCQAKGGRSWWTTLTFDEVHLSMVRTEARKLPLPRVRSSGDPADDRKRAEAARVERAAYAHLQRYFKRLRVVGKAGFRYLAIFELGEKHGRGHYHVLFHETRAPLSSRLLEGQWRSISQPRLVRDQSNGLAGYLTKYLTKSLGTRPRASVRYGDLKSDHYPGMVLPSRQRMIAGEATVSPMAGNEDARGREGGPGGEAPRLIPTSGICNSERK